MEHVFVYGTLKTGQCREKCWPFAPQLIQTAWTHGQLFDLGPYPAMVPGQHQVLGELWSFSAEEIVRVLQVLDLVEGTEQLGESNEYNRHSVVVYLENGAELVAHTYIYARTENLLGLLAQPPTKCVAGADFVVWPVSSNAGGGN